MALITKPMLASVVSGDGLAELDFPVLASPKIDGIRCLIHPELGPVSRSFKPIPNEYISHHLTHVAGGCLLDGELIGLDKHRKPVDFNQTQSMVMAHGGTPNFEYRAFDCFDFPDESFSMRIARAITRVIILDDPSIVSVPHIICTDYENLVMHTERFISQGYEGTMIRSMDGLYKSGRSTLKQGWLLKYKEWADAEGTITGFEALYHNDNPDLRDNLGHAKRSSHKENMVAMNTLGALVLHTTWGELRVGTGFDAATRAHIWEHQHEFLGKQATFKYQPHGMQDLPRFPVYLSIREEGA